MTGPEEESVVEGVSQTQQEVGGKGGEKEGKGGDH